MAEQELQQQGQQWQDHYQRGRTETDRSLSYAEEMRKSVAEQRAKGFRADEDVKQAMHVMNCEDLERDARAKTWYFVKNPVFCILPEQGVSRETIYAALAGIQYVRSYGVSFSTRIVRQPERVTNVIEDVCAIEDGRVPEGVAGDAFGILEDIVMQGSYRPGMLILLNRDLEGPDGPQGMSYPDGIVIARPSSRVSHDLLVAHELVHYLRLDGRHDGQYRRHQNRARTEEDWGHCVTDPCIMNVKRTTSQLCDHHQATVRDYHAGVMDALRGRGIRE